MVVLTDYRTFSAYRLCGPDPIEVLQAVLDFLKKYELTPYEINMIISDEINGPYEAIVYYVA